MGVALPNELYCATYDDVLPQLRHTLLEYSIQHTKYLSSCGLISHISRTMSKPSHHPLILDRSPWLQHLGQLPYPFSYQLVSWFCSEVSTTCYFPLTQVPLPFRFKLVGQCSFHYTNVAVTSTGLINEGYLTVLSRLV
jgi:hypothetical protein